MIAAVLVAMAGVVAYFVTRKDTLSSPLSPSATSSRDSRAVDTPPSPAPTLDADEIDEKDYTLVGSYRLLETVPHDSSAFTQGLLIENGTLYEGTGLYQGRSNVRIVDLASGSVLLQTDLEDEYFGEGIAYYPDKETGEGRIIQLTWREQTGFIYNASNLERLETFTYSTHTSEGWGISYIAERHEFFVTDGSHYLITWDADTREETSRIPVMMRYINQDEQRLKWLNELEYDPFTNTVLANVWQKDVLARIDARRGFVTTIYGLSGLFVDRPQGADVLNGIALTDKPNELWVTGKWWPNMYRIRLLDPIIR